MSDVNLLDERRLNPDFVILDLNLPKLSGLTILEQHNPKVGPPIVVLSGSENAEDRKLALAKGAKDYVVKPMGFEPFLELVKQIVQRWGSGVLLTNQQNLISPWLPTPALL